MPDPTKEAPAAEGGAAEQAGTGQPAAKVEVPKPDDQKKLEAQAAEAKAGAEAAKVAEEKAAADAAAKAEADKLAGQPKPGEVKPKPGEELTPEAKAAEEAAQADKKMRETWEKLRKEGIGLNDDQMLAIENFATANKLDNAGKALIIHQQDQILAQQKAAWQETQKKWVNDLQTDKEFGGKAFASSMEGAKRVASKYIDAEDQKMLDETGLGNSPILLKAFARIHRDLMAADSFVPAGDDPGRTGKQKTAEEALFPNSDANQEAIE